MIIAGKVLTKSQKRAFRIYLEGRDFNPDYVFSNWKEYQETLSGPSAPRKVDTPAPALPLAVERVVRRGRGPGKAPAGNLYSIRLAPALLASLRSRAQAEARPSSEIVRLALQAYLATPSRLGSPEAVPAALPEDS
jgi:hypothetical protein